MDMSVAHMSNLDILLLRLGEEPVLVAEHGINGNGYMAPAAAEQIGQCVLAWQPVDGKIRCLTPSVRMNNHLDSLSGKITSTLRQAGHRL